MRKALPYLGAALATLALAWSSPVKAQDMFKDLEANHWAYQAVTDLQSRGILEGYPGGYFRGKRFLSRYEFAVALKRALDKIQLMPGPKGDTGPQGPQGDAGPAGRDGSGGGGVDAESVANLKKLVDEFRPELAALRVSVGDVSKRLDDLSKDVNEIKARLDKMPHIHGGFFGGFQSARSRNAFVDQSGVLRPAANGSHFANVTAVHDFHLGVDANLSGGVKLSADIINSNYTGYRAAGGTNFGAAAANGNGAPQETTLYKATLSVPISAFGSNTSLTLGRFGHSVGHLTYMRPDTDVYFSNPWYDDGNYIQDGFKLESKYGSVSTSLWAGSFTSLTTSAGNVLNSPGIGRSVGPRYLSSLKPIDTMGAEGMASQVAGIHLGLPLAKIGDLGLTLIDLSGVSAPALGTPYNHVIVYGANLNLKEIGRLKISAEASKSVTQKDFDSGDGRDNEDNNAYTLHVGYGSGPLNVGVGYKYIDPRFAAPGYWGRIGNWFNPTNVRGPYANVDWKVSGSLTASLSGAYYEGARNRNYGSATSGLNISDNIGHAKASLKYALSSKVDLMGAYEGVFWDLSAASSAAGAAKPVEQYITLGAGINLAGNTVLKLAYQMLAFSNTGGGFGLPAGINGNSNASIFTTQVAVRF